MRQIVQLDEPIVQEQRPAWPASVAISGRADAHAWRGGPVNVVWNLSRAIGFLLVTVDSVEAQCAAGNRTRLEKGDLLILNEATAPQTFFSLRECTGHRVVSTGQATVHAGRTLTRALHGSIHFGRSDWDAQPFARAAAWSMAVVHLSEREFARAASLAQLLADETGETSEVRTEGDSAHLVARLETTLFEVLASVLWARDPMSLPQLASGGDKRIVKALLAMAAEPGKPWRIETIAHEVAMSRTAFAMLFRKVVGKTPLDHLTALRIQLAATMLATQPAYSIDSIAREVGYADESALRRAYLRATGEPLKRRAETTAKELVQNNPR